MILIPQSKPTYGGATPPFGKPCRSTLLCHNRCNALEGWHCGCPLYHSSNRRNDSREMGGNLNPEGRVNVVYHLRSRCSYGNLRAGIEDASIVQSSQVERASMMRIRLSGTFRAHVSTLFSGRSEQYLVLCFPPSDYLPLQCFQRRSVALALLLQLVPRFFQDNPTGNSSSSKASSSTNGASHGLDL